MFICWYCEEAKSDEDRVIPSIFPMCNTCGLFKVFTLMATQNYRISNRQIEADYVRTHVELYPNSYLAFKVRELLDMQSDVV